jgi:hypothetical protein
MADKIHNFSSDGHKVQLWAFHCPGCGYDHAFTVGPPDGDRPRWSFNGSLEKPTFKPSLLCNKDFPDTRCHSFATDDRIQFLQDCWHKLKGQTVDLPDWES